MRRRVLMLVLEALFELGLVQRLALACGFG
jgi:hypothetical protein